MPPVLPGASLLCPPAASRGARPRRARKLQVQTPPTPAPSPPTLGVPARLPLLHLLPGGVQVGAGACGEAARVTHPAPARVRRKTPRPASRAAPDRQGQLATGEDAAAPRPSGVASSRPLPWTPSPGSPEPSGAVEFPQRCPPPRGWLGDGAGAGPGRRGGKFPAPSPQPAPQPSDLAAQARPRPRGFGERPAQVRGRVGACGGSPAHPPRHSLAARLWGPMLR